MFISIIPEKQNKHYGTEAIRRLIEYGEKKLELEKLELYVAKKNLRAIHCYEKHGFTINGNGITDNDVHMIKYLKIIKSK